MKKLVFSLLALSILIACNESATSNADKTTVGQMGQSKVGGAESDTLRKEVLELHDKVMPEMMPMGKLQTELMAASVGSPDSADIMVAATELKYAKEAMMTWMRDFSGNFKEDWTEAEKVAFLKNEKAKMERIDIKTQAALSNGRALLSKLNGDSDAQDSASVVE